MWCLGKWSVYIWTEGESEAATTLPRWTSSGPSTLTVPFTPSARHPSHPPPTNGTQESSVATLLLSHALRIGDSAFRNVEGGCLARTTPSPSPSPTHTPPQVSSIRLKRQSGAGREWWRELFAGLEISRFDRKGSEDSVRRKQWQQRRRERLNYKANSNAKPMQTWREQL